MHDQLISFLVLRRQRQIYRIIVARPTNLCAFYRAPIKPSARESILRASVIGGRYDADEIAAIIGDHVSRRARGYNRVQSRVGIYQRRVSSEIDICMRVKFTHSDSCFRYAIR